jgi:tripeptide aminopeptidase
MAPHLDRGASVRIEAVAESAGDLAADGMLRWVAEFYDSNPGFTLACEASEGRDGYSHPYRARPVEGGLRLDVRIRDFAVAGLERRVEHVRKRAGDLPFSTARQYVNMGPRLAPHPELVTLAHAAAAAIGLAATVSPIRGGTGVDPFLDAGVPIANLGTGYFAPESEKEFTSLQAMVGHAKWLFALVQLAG